MKKKKSVQKAFLLHRAGNPVKECTSFMCGSETKLQLKLDASCHLSKFYICQARYSVRLTSQALEREHHKLTFIRKWQHWKKPLTFFYIPLSLNSFLLLFQMQLARPLPESCLSAATAGYRTINLPDQAIGEMQVMPQRRSKCHEYRNKNWFILTLAFSHLLWSFGTSGVQQFAPLSEAFLFSGV